ncbi:MAG: SDR family oxidoreductase [Methanomicrobiaceae archaeon]|uniref:Glucose 1-dehydrogenase n=1 Tax=hydrocarbon metagenome TaxID=938273 RepID=A0A0W8FHL0_9ZZZZ|nr:SDR family oxidoreductase [Methanomicrobiaceae archaeon]MDD5419104.1 SDR family oxidoreductase [Methanomicrobiaceae archaeon]
MKRLEGRNALVTGSSRGIGRAIAVRFAEEGANVAINYNESEDEAHVTEKEVKEAFAIACNDAGRCMVIRADVSQEGEVQAMFERILSEWGRLDILVNNAGILAKSLIHEMPMEEFDRVLAVNLRGAFLCAREAVRHFLARGGGGAIVNNSSVHETIPAPRYIHYAISKSGMENLTKTLALEYARDGIRVNTVGPGAIRTAMTEAVRSNPETEEEMLERIPLGRFGMAGEMAAVFAFLASDDASYITGQTLYACGGLTIYPSFSVPQSHS